MHSYLSMNLFATFAFLLPGHPTLSTTFDYLKQRKKTAEKIDTNAQWFHCSWSVLLKRVNIRVRGFHLVFWTEHRTTYDETFDGLHLFRAFQTAADDNFVAMVHTCCVSTWDLVNVFFGKKVGIKRRVSTRMSMANAMSKKSQQKDTADTADSWTNRFDRTGVH